MPPQWLVILPAAILLAALPLVWWARRGRRVDEHPLCRKCGFDLFGKPADSTRCPECGRDVTHARAIRIGNRQPRRRVLAAVMPFIVLPGLGLALLAYGAMTGIDWNRHKPVGWLVREAQGTDIPIRDRALVELRRRTDEDLLSAAQIVEIADAALDHQGDANQTWLPAWGDLVERLHGKGRLPAEAWARYARQALAGSLKLWHRTYVRREDSMVVQVRSEPPRLFGTSFWVSWNDGDARPDEYSGHAVERKSEGKQGRGFRWPDPQSHYLSCGLFAPSPDIAAKLSDGPQSLRVSLNMHVYDGPSAAKPVLEEPLQLHGKWDLHPKTDPPVRLRTDANLREAVAKSISVSVSEMSQGNSPAVLVQMKAGPRPVHLAVAPVLRAGSREWAPPKGIAAATSFPAELTRAGETMIQIDGDLPDKVDVVLRRMPEKMQGSWSVWEIWGEEIVIPNVKVQR